jgi:hypothetical protein
VLKCRDVVDDADLLVAGELPWQRRLQVWIHLLICKYCRLYVRQLRVLIDAVPFMHRKATDQEVSDIMKKCDESGDP